MPELLAQDALVQAVTGVEQHRDRDRTVHHDLDRLHRAHLVVIRNGGDRPLVGLEHIDLDVSAILRGEKTVDQCGDELIEVITRTANGPREAQVALKFYW